MIDLNTLISNALTAAVQQAVAPLNERIAALEGDISHRAQVQQANITAALAERIATLESVCATQHEAMVAMRDRIAALENNPAQGVDTQATPTTDITRHIIDALGNTDHPLFKRLSSFMDAVAEQAMDDHCSTYDHDDYDNHIGDDDKHFDGDIEDAVRDALSNMTFDVSIR